MDDDLVGEKVPINEDIILEVVEDTVDCSNAGFVLEPPRSDKVFQDDRSCHSR